MEPLTVTAQLEAGVAHAGPWGIALDGLLASVLHMRAKAQLLADGGEHTPLVDQVDVEDLSLPLARCGEGGDWHWAATCAWPGEHARSQPPEVVTWHSRPDHRHLVDLTGEDLRQHIDEDSGRYRRYAMPLLVTLTDALVWRAVGDVEEIRSLLSGVQAIGKKRSTGHGRVLNWSVEPSRELEAWAAAHTHPDKTLGRPVPGSCLQLAAASGLATEPPEGTAGIRPPYSHPSRRRQLLLPVLEPSL